jgi:sulfur relay (sulfurtransferase) DsrF/TusC family protein
VDRIMEEGFEQLQAILAKMTLTDDERRFVDDAARQLYQKTFSYLIDYPGYEQLRPVVIALAMAFWLGPSSSWDQCMRSVL